MIYYGKDYNMMKIKKILLGIILETNMKNIWININNI